MVVGVVDSVQQAEGSNIGWRTASRTFLPHEFPFLESGVYNSVTHERGEIGLFGTGLVENQCSRTTRTLCAVKERVATKGEGKEERGREKSKENINTVGDRRCSRIEV